MESCFGCADSDRVKDLVKRTGENASATGQVEAAQQADIVLTLVQNRPEHWEFYFRRSDHYGCYRSDGETTEGLAPPYDEGDIADFPQTGDTPESCP